MNDEDMSVQEVIEKLSAVEQATLISASVRELIGNLGIVQTAETLLKMVAVFRDIKKDDDKANLRYSNKDKIFSISAIPNPLRN